MLIFRFLRNFMIFVVELMLMGFIFLIIIIIINFVFKICVKFLFYNKWIFCDIKLWFNYNVIYIVFEVDGCWRFLVVVVGMFYC